MQPQFSVDWSNKNELHIRRQSELFLGFCAAWTLTQGIHVLKVRKLGWWSSIHVLIIRIHRSVLEHLLVSGHWGATINHCRLHTLRGRTGWHTRHIQWCVPYVPCSTSCQVSTHGSWGSWGNHGMRSKAFSGLRSKKSSPEEYDPRIPSWEVLREALELLLDLSDTGVQDWRLHKDNNYIQLASSWYSWSG